MDPLPRTLRVLRSGFPRTRGDGPQATHLPDLSPEFPPHARGWTFRLRNTTQDVVVSPARAGMDPLFTIYRSAGRSFPRTRGDGPFLVRRTHDDSEFPPHARGWTGCDRAQPRLEVVSPHARGWTLRQALEDLDTLVSPARAGMDPCSCSRRSTPVRFPRTRGMDLVDDDVEYGGNGFPRTRGDGPFGKRTTTDEQMFPPHARGWTRNRSNGLGEIMVSPARAGMDPLQSIGEQIAESFPRTRGDGPITEHRRADRREFPPHARGWTAGMARRWGTTGVSPARAGMDPRKRSVSATAVSFPRTRGDGPTCPRR